MFASVSTDLYETKREIEEAKGKKAKKKLFWSKKIDPGKCENK
jgi:hypothetical protein